jgi:arylsulfatase A-like enzyme
MLRRCQLALTFLVCCYSPIGWSDQPNVLIILADDMGWRDVSYNGSEIRTPNIDALATDGLVLGRFYAQPTCSPTRSSLMTGRSALRNGVLLPIDKNNWQGLPLNIKILPQYFKDADYQTALIGKWHLGHAYRQQLPNARGFDYSYGHLLGGVGYWDHIHGGGLDWHRNGVPLREEGYATHLITDEAIRHLEQRDPERPLFMYVSYTAPHLPNEAPAATIDSYAGIAGENRRIHAAMVDELDQGIGRLLLALERQGLRENTLVWFMSDNGGLVAGSGIPRLDSFMQLMVDWFGIPLPGDALEFARTNIQDGGSDNGPYRRGKGSVYEGGVLVPSVITWPGVIGPGRLRQRVTVQDVLPTLAAAADLPLPQDVLFDGGNLWAAIAGEGEVKSPDYVTTGVDGEAYYQGDWKLVLVGEEEPQLYELSSDPTETTDVASEKTPRVEAMLKQLVTFERGESIHQTGWFDILMDPDRFGGEEDREPWLEQVRD